MVEEKFAAEKIEADKMKAGEELAKKKLENSKAMTVAEEKRKAEANLAEEYR